MTVTLALACAPARSTGTAAPKAAPATSALVLQVTPLEAAVLGDKLTVQASLTNTGRSAVFLAFDPSRPWITRSGEITVTSHGPYDGDQVCFQKQTLHRLDVGERLQTRVDVALPAAATSDFIGSAYSLSLSFRVVRLPTADACGPIRIVKGDASIWLATYGPRDRADLPVPVPRPVTTDAALSRLVAAVYRPDQDVDPSGTGSLADTLRVHRAMGAGAGDANLQADQRRGADLLRKLEAWQHANPAAGPDDRSAAERIIADLRLALSVSGS